MKNGCVPVIERDYNVDPETWEEIGIDMSKLRGRKTVCPKCDPTRRNKGQRDLSIDFEKGAYKCWNDGCDFKGFLKGFNQTWTPGKKEYATPETPKHRRISEAGENFLASRGISLDTADRYGLYTEHRRDIGECIAFPYRDQYGKIVHVKYRAINSKEFRTTLNTERVFYGIGHVNTSISRVHVVEGELDLLAMVEAGIPNVLSVPDGSSLDRQGEKLACMESAADLLERTKSVTLALDADEAGESMSDEIVRRIGREKCRRVTFPPHCKDANDVLLRHGVEAVRDVVRRAEYIPVEGIISIRDFADEIWEKRSEIGKPHGWHVPVWPRLSEHYRMEPGQLTIILATPESGKSSWMRSYLINVARANRNIFSGMFVPEDSPARDFWTKMLRIEAGRVQQMKNNQREEFDKIVDFIDDHFRIVEPESYSLQGILERGRVMVYRHGMNVMVIDPWTEVRYDHLSGQSELRQIELALSEAREFGKRYGVAMNIIVHPRKVYGKDEDISPYDARGTATWYDKADRFLILSREDKNARSDVTTVKVSKTRNKAYGRNGEVRFLFDPETERFMEENDDVLM